MSFQKSTWWDLSVKVYLIKLSLERKSTESSDSLEDQTCEREVLDLQSVHLREQNSSDMLHVTCYMLSLQYSQSTWSSCYDTNKGKERLLELEASRIVN